MPNKKPYRLGAYGYVIDAQSRLLLVQQKSYKDNEWSLPGGGREDGEDALQNIYRELYEELRISKEHLNLIGVSKHAIQYDFPGEMTQNGDPMAERYQGQRKDQVVFRLAAEAKDVIRLDTSELRDYMWCTFDQLDSHLLFPGQAEETKRVLAEFGF